MNETILTSLGSAGLVRRARKALEKSQPQMQDYGFEFEGQKGQLDWDNPLASRCDCGASGLCKHIVAAALYLLERPASPETRVEEPPRVELHLAELLNDAGKTQVRRCISRVSAAGRRKLSLRKAQSASNWRGSSCIFGAYRGCRILSAPKRRSVMRCSPSGSIAKNRPSPLNGRNGCSMSRRSCSIWGSRAAIS